jgi:hypothetical protein
VLLAVVGDAPVGAVHAGGGDGEEESGEGEGDEAEGDEDEAERGDGELPEALLPRKALLALFATSAQVVEARVVPHGLGGPPEFGVRAG